MKIFFVRHGHPDYANDCLTELGRRQAAAAAERLKDCGIGQVFSSTKGRAMQTAEYTAKALGLNVIPCDFMREISWQSVDGEPIPANGHPWNLSDIFASEGKTLTDKEWYIKEPYCRSKAVSSAGIVTEGLDAWLSELGYQREGEYYRAVDGAENKTIAMFSHGGSSSVALSHILNIPFPQFCGIVHPDFTSITVIEFSDKIGELFCPRVLLMNDSRHIEGLENIKIYEE
ncbi:MAG: histidine phosphatase family protein [Ruminococcaceae bacterium]|nr:histidine phosphatase family protein [Oscillospiraceae bacterium]